MHERPVGRPIFITITGVLQTFLSLVLLCFAIAGGFSYISTIYMLLAAMGLLTAAGNFRLRNWARFSTLTFSALFIVLPIGVVIFYIRLNNLRDPNNAADDDLMAYLAGILFVLMLIALTLAALGGFWLYYFNRRSIKQLFANAEKESS